MNFTLTICSTNFHRRVLIDQFYDKYDHIFVDKLELNSINGLFDAMY